MGSLNDQTNYTTRRDGSKFLRSSQEFVVDSSRTRVELEYIQSHLGEILTRCLAEVCEKRPHDPIEYIAQWIYKNRENETHVAIVSMRINQSTKIVNIKIILI